MFTYILLLFSFLIAFPSQAEVLATISYTGKKGPVKIQITHKEFRKTYNTVRQVAPNAPSIQQFFQEYLRYRIGVEAAYNDPRFIKNPALRNMFADPLLKEGFEQLLYKSFADKKLKKRIAQLDKTAKKLSKNVMLKFYRKNPEYDMHFIVISLPADPKPFQVKAAQERAIKVYNEVKNSKKPFPELVDIYSDDRLSGRINMPRSANTIYPTIYKQLKKMRAEQVSHPIRAGNGFYIVKLNRKIPFGEANRTQIKAAYFDQKRSRILARYFDSLKSKYKVQINKASLNKLR
ncbi:MAG: peptidylprolyl isomerase [Bdellovibrionales bacterium]|nr:peptidylprolyl isomerase [Bdellovibrionales bacterium]